MDVGREVLHAGDGQALAAIEHGQVDPARQRELADRRADVAGAADEQDSHGVSLLQVTVPSW